MNNLIPNGSKITTKSGNLEGITKGICIRGLENNISVEYHVGMFRNGEYVSVWLFDFEIQLKKDNSSPAGFHKTSNHHKVIEQ